MKNIFKLVAAIVLISLLAFCSNNDITFPQQDITEGFWKLKNSMDKNKTSNEVSVFFQFDGLFLNVYVQEGENSNLIITEKYPASYFENKLTLMNPFQEDEIISIVELDNNNNFINSKAIYENGEIEYSSTNVKSDITNYFICRSCYALCYVTHDALGISDLDWLCCFYLNC